MNATTRTQLQTIQRDSIPFESQHSSLNLLEQMHRACTVLSRYSSGCLASSVGKSSATSVHVCKRSGVKGPVQTISTQVSFPPSKKPVCSGWLLQKTEESKLTRGCNMATCVLCNQWHTLPHVVLLRSEQAAWK